MPKGIILPLPRLGITPPASGKLWLWQPGTTTKQTCYSDSDLATAVTQPLVADAAGLFSAVYLDPSLGYKLGLYPSTEANDPPTGSAYLTQDNLYLPASHVDALVCQGRPTLESSVPVSTSDQTAKTTIYFTPYGGSAVALYNTTKAAWEVHTFTEVSLSLTGLAANTNYDLFLYDNAGTKTLEQVAWSSATVRATALTTQNGVLVKSGTASKRYVGTFRTTGTIGQCEDSAAKRLVWSYYNRVRRDMLMAVATSTWTYSTATFRQANADTANQLEFVVGVSGESEVHAEIHAGVTVTVAGTLAMVGIGEDSTTAIASKSYQEYYQVPVITHIHRMASTYDGAPAAGRHILVWIEYGAAVTVTWQGSNVGSKMLGSLDC